MIIDKYSDLLKKDKEISEKNIKELVKTKNKELFFELENKRKKQFKQDFINLLNN